jgi:hypothetical protein
LVKLYRFESVVGTQQTSHFSRRSSVIPPKEDLN